MKNVRPIALVAFTAAAACSAGVPGPSLHDMEPSSGSALDATPVTIVGRDFYLGVDERFDAPSAAVDATFTADLDGVALEAVSWVDLEHLSAVVPAGLPDGHHTLVVVSPLGMKAMLPEAFEVEDGGSDTDGAH